MTISMVTKMHLLLSLLGIFYIQCSNGAKSKYSKEFNPEANPEEVLGAYNEDNDYSKGLFKSKRAMLIWQKASRNEVQLYITFRLMWKVCWLCAIIVQ